jgi:hypothetical protein
MTDDLYAAYRATDYVVETPGGEVVIRPGEHSAQVDLLLARYGAKTAVFITAWNPFSRSIANRENDLANKKLEGRLRKSGLIFLRGEGRARIGDWPAERSFLVFGADRARAGRLGTECRQNAVVFVERGRPAELFRLN